MTKDRNSIYLTEEESCICKLDGIKFKSSKLMIWHVRKNYNLNFEKYIIKAYYDDIRPVCLKTGKSLSFNASKLGPFFKNYSKNNFPRNPHTDETKKKIKIGCKKTSNLKFGVNNVFQSDWCKNKIRNTMLERYGVDNIMKFSRTKEFFSTIKKSKNTIHKTKTTNLKKYGHVTYTCTDENKLKLRKQHYIRHYGDWNSYVDTLNDLRLTCLGTENDILSYKKSTFSCNICSSKWDSVTLITNCPKCDMSYLNCRSKEESSLVKWLKENIKCEMFINKRFTDEFGKVYEADVYIPSKNIIIEFNGLYWHSENGGKKDRNYHVKKIEFFEKMDNRVISIFEDEWLFKTKIVKSKLLHILNANTVIPIYARKCIVRKIKNSECADFLESNHIQGSSNASVCYGAYYNDKLVSVMTFSKKRIATGYKSSAEDEYEMVRFATDIKERIVGIAGKLLKLFITDHNPKKIISYADRRFTFMENIYSKIGFDFISKTEPNYWYVKKYKRLHRFQFQKHKLSKILDSFDNNLTEWENMQRNGYDRIWDCGHLKYELNLR